MVGGIMTVNKPLHIGYECPVWFIVTKEDFLDEPPVSADLTAYDQAHLKLYMRLLDAEADGPAWEEVVQVLFGLDPAADAIRAAKIPAAHLARPNWMTELGYRHLLRSSYNLPRGDAGSASRWPTFDLPNPKQTWKKTDK